MLWLISSIMNVVLLNEWNLSTVFSGKISSSSQKFCRGGGETHADIYRNDTFSVNAEDKKNRFQETHYAHVTSR